MEGHAKLMVVTMTSVNAADPNPLPPSAVCCKALDNADFKCLCFFKNSKWMTEYKVDFNRAKELPGKCNLGKSFPC
ncbi:Dolichyl-diphosphooligosaccharide-protein glycosyltransferase 48kDa subunit family protein [Hibiscus syriacus]|uniref:Dolichyl-diphosphooligosaccharide-protein glycosyltransferase 48kDa subunit family protein n=1 Tax=Hibiscus syriacus TaxID=106335 RepID=A0A6A3A5Q9_HIBSY|nr:Dolichyl-diphosphooligosaccharide-protein glycosyltransferase 48kDa subunit family protein [Hibiscus syriacus]